MTEEQIRQMADRFLQWKLPEDFSPDGGISFKREFNEHTAHPMKHEPSGTNLLTATQAEAMVRFMAEEATVIRPSISEEKVRSVLDLLDVYVPGEFTMEMAATITTRALTAA